MTDRHMTKIAHELFFGKLAMHDFMHNLKASMQVPQLCTATNIHIEQYIMHTTTVLHGQNDLTMILARSSQDIAKILPTPRTTSRTRPCGTSLLISTLVVLKPEVLLPKTKE